ncbi:hypothetical protein, partial [Arthrobacter woluwensis]
MTAYARTSDPGTSHEAAAKVRTGWCESLVLDALYSQRNNPVTHRVLVKLVHGICDQNIRTAGNYPEDSSIRSRCSELVKRGVVESAGSVKGEKRH